MHASMTPCPHNSMHLCINAYRQLCIHVSEHVRHSEAQRGTAHHSTSLYPCIHVSMQSMQQCLHASMQYRFYASLLVCTSEHGTAQGRTVHSSLENILVQHDECGGLLVKLSEVFVCEVEPMVRRKQRISTNHYAENLLIPLAYTLGVRSRYGPFLRSDVFAR